MHGKVDQGSEQHEDWSPPAVPCVVGQTSLSPGGRLVIELEVAQQVRHFGLCRSWELWVRPWFSCSSHFCTVTADSTQHSIHTSHSITNSLPANTTQPRQQWPPPEIQFSPPFIILSQKPGSYQSLARSITSKLPDGERHTQMQMQAGPGQPSGRSSTPHSNQLALARQSQGQGCARQSGAKLHTIHRHRRPSSA